MIPKQDILDRASEWQLRPDVVEKDYVLGWLLAVIGGLSETNESWVFKGGTCIKKCFFETYRFSEDLDFSLLPEAAYTDAAIKNIAIRLASQAQEWSGIEFPPNLVEVRAKQNKQGKPTFQIRLSYRGPLGGPSNFPRVLFDLTQYEPVIDSPVRQPIIHSYPDVLPENATVLSYSFNELLAEKTRALLERTRPRDLYDVVYLLDNQPEAFDLSEVHQLLQEKCEVKGIEPPTCEGLLQIIREAEELRTEWKNMLGCHRSLQTQPGRGTSKPASLSLHLVYHFSCVFASIVLQQPCQSPIEMSSFSFSSFSSSLPCMRIGMLSSSSSGCGYVGNSQSFPHIHSLYSS